MNPGDPGDGGGGDGIPGLTPVPGQQVVGPTAQSSTVVNLGGQVLDSFSFDWSSFAVSLFRVTFRLRIANFIKVVAFFDGGGEDLNSPVLAKVGHLMPLRGLGILVALRVEITVSIRLLIIISWKHGFDFSPWGSDSGFGLGSLVIGFELDIDIDIEIFFMVALVLPNGSLKVLALEDFDLNFHFMLDADGHKLTFNKRKHEVRPRRIGPLLGVPFLCEDRFQLADDNGETSFTDASGGTLSYYFVRGPGRCCLRWNFDLDLIQITDDGSETSIQPPFDADFCLNALDSSNQNIPIVVSDQCPGGSDGIPGEEQLTIGDPDKDEDHLRALMRPVDAATGNFLPADELEDVTEEGYAAYFYLKNSDDEVLDSHALFGDGKTGLAVPTETGQNRICVQLSEVPVNIIQIGEVPSFWPGAVTGFSILSFLARGLAPALRFECESSVGLPVTVNAPVAGELTVWFDVGYMDNSNPPKFVPTSILERNEPFELIQRDYVLQARIVRGSGVTQEQTLTFNVDEVLMAAPLAGLGFGRNRSSDDPKLFFTGALAQKDSHVAVDLRGKDLSKPIVVSGLTIKPNNLEEGTIANATDPLIKLVPPGRAVNNADAKVTIKIGVTSDDANTTVRIGQKLPDLSVSNGETFEEYLRVFKEVEKILADAGTKFSGFAKKFYDDLTAHGHGSGVIEPQGTQLWKDAYERVQGVGGAAVKDDWPLYWARLQGIGALRAYGKRKTPAVTAAALEQAINQFEWTSRGMDLNGRIIFDGVPATTRKVVVTGFDPFELPSLTNRSNPSGLIALEFHKQSVGSSTPPVHIRTAIFPVRYKEFDAGWVEKAFEISLDTLVMLMTTSMNGSRDFYDVERWAGKNRILGDTDNNNMEATGTPVTVGSPPRSTNFLDPGGQVGGGDEFLHSTLPYKLVITSAQTLKGPHRDQTPFVIDQSYRVIDTTATAFTAGEFRPEPNAGDTAAFQEQPDSPDSSKKANRGSGGNYLSNEIFYRTALRREDRRKSLASGHFHIPGTDTTPETTGPKLIEGVTKALGDFVDHLASLQPRITNFSPRAGRPGDSFTIAGEHFDGAGAVLIGTTNLDTFNVDDPTQITAEVNDTARTGKITVTTPYGTAVSSDVFGVIRRGPREDFGPLLIARRAELELTAAEAAFQIGARLGTYRRWERGQDRPSARFEPAITTFLGRDPTPDPVAFGESIRAARERDGLTRSQLAQRLGLASSTVKAWETGAVSRPSTRVSSIFEEYVAQE